MARINPVNVETADPKAQKQLEGVKKAMGMTPNLLATLGQSPAALGAYLGFGQALSGGTLGSALREQIAIAVAGANSCEYCASAHTAAGKGLGVDKAELAANLDGRSSDEQTSAALEFAVAIVQNRGWISDGDVAAVRNAGFTEAQVVELSAEVAFNTFTNYFNHIAETEVDFPRVEVEAPALA